MFPLPKSSANGGLICSLAARRLRLLRHFAPLLTSILHIQVPRTLKLTMGWFVLSAMPDGWNNPSARP
jgi:hypothetical protein